MRKKSKKLIDFDEYVLINGIEQYLLHSGTKQDNPVLLFLHGGPGNAESIYAYSFQQKWTDIFTVVHWDQRGAGKTLMKNQEDHPTVDIMIEDLRQLVEYLKGKYNRDKIILLGHSWGSVLGSLFVKRYPQLVEYYMGVGQVINMAENERVGLEKLKEMIELKGDKKAMKILDEVGDYPGKVFDSCYFENCRKVRGLQGKYGLGMKVTLSLFIKMFKSPIFGFTDFKAMSKIGQANMELYKYLFRFDLEEESYDYDVPVYYIFGGDDWQTPYTIAQKYFKKINAPCKKFFLVPKAGHITMMDQPDIFYDVLREISKIECKVL